MQLCFQGSPELQCGLRIQMCWQCLVPVPAATKPLSDSSAATQQLVPCADRNLPKGSELHCWTKLQWARQGMNLWDDRREAVPEMQVLLPSSPLILCCWRKTGCGGLALAKLQAPFPATTEQGREKLMEVSWVKDWEQTLQGQIRLTLEVQSELITNKIRWG